MLLPLAFLLLAVEAAPVAPAEPLAFREFFEPSRTALQPTQRLQSLAGKRVRLVGYMARMDAPPKGGFFLCAIPVLATEAGAGTADLPPDAVFVVVRSAAGKELAHIPRLLDVSGVLELGAQVDEDGRLSRIRILLDGPPADAADGAPVQPTSSNAAPHIHSR